MDPAVRRRSSSARPLAFAVVLLLGIVATAAIAVLAVTGAGRPPVDHGQPDPLVLRNGRAFIQDNLWTSGERQYGVWVQEDGSPVVFARDREDGRTDTFDLSSVAGNPLAAPTEPDLHNVYAIAVDADGYVHVAGNMHDSPLRYVRSRHPHDISAWVGATIPGTEGLGVTYPTFVGLPSGGLLLLYREGHAGAGSIRAAVHEAGAWRDAGTLIDGRPTGESPYLHHVAIGRETGTIHAMFVWRSGPDATSNQDLSYALSTDAARTWERSDGTPYALPIAHDEVEVAFDVAGGTMSNSGGLGVDHEGRAHAALQVTGADGIPHIRHVWLDEGRWRSAALLRGEETSRPAVAVDSAGEVYLIVVRAGPARSRPVAELIEVADGAVRNAEAIGEVPAKDWEAVFDTNALREEGRVEILVGLRDGRPRVLDATLPGRRRPGS